MVKTLQTIHDLYDQDFDLKTVSWVTPRLAVTDMDGARSVCGDPGIYIINTAAEITTPCDFKLAVEPHEGPEAVRETLDVLADVIHEQMESTENNVVVHCFAGMERSVLACVWYLHKYQGMSIDYAYQVIYDERPIILDRRYWADCDDRRSDNAVTYTLLD
jgi:hypothetical protein